MYSRDHRAIAGRTTRGAFHVRDRRELLAPLRPHGKDAGHVAPQPQSTRRNLEITIRLVDRDGRGEWPKFLPVLDGAVEPLAHRGLVRRREDAPVAERARPQLAGALH